jgi:hypothetical protein
MATGDIPHWLEKERGRDWDTLLLGESIFPGLVRISLKASKSFDIGKAQGNDGAPVTFKGRQPKELSIEHVMWTAEQFAEFLQLVKDLNLFTNGVAEKPFEIICPMAQAFNVRSVYVKDVDVPAPNAGLWTVKWSIIENNPTKAAKQSTKPKSAASGQTFGDAGFPPDNGIF